MCVRQTATGSERPSRTAVRSTLLSTRPYSIGIPKRWPFFLQLYTTHTKKSDEHVVLAVDELIYLGLDAPLGGGREERLQLLHHLQQHTQVAVP